MTVTSENSQPDDTWTPPPNAKEATHANKNENVMRFISETLSYRTMIESPPPWNTLSKYLLLPPKRRTFFLLPGPANALSR